MKTWVALTISLVAVTLASGCAKSTSHDLMPPPPTYHADRASGGQLTIEFNPRVDILFVVDNSLSMGTSKSDKNDELKWLRDASAKFADALGGNSVLDYRVGVITVFDDTHCGDQCYPEGKLRSPFVSRSKDAAAQIRNALDIKPASISHDLPPAERGPEIEKVFSPILKAFTPEMNRVNGNFIRNDSRVVIIVVTDENDSSFRLSVDQFLDGIDQAVGLSRVDMHAIVTLRASDRAGYVRDRAPKRIIEAVEQMGGRIFDITNPNYGAHLAAIVSDVRKRVMSQRLFLPSTPESGTLKLFYGDQEVKSGWSYNPSLDGRTPPTISIHDDIKVEYDPNKRFRAEYIKIEDYSRRNGKVTINYF